MKKLIILILVGVFLLSSFFCSPAKARAEAEEFESTGSRVTVVPAKFELTGKQGEKIVKTLRITNEDNADALFVISVQGLGVANQYGDVELGDAYAFPNLFSQWVKFKENGIQFKPKETKNIDFEINIPKNAEPGGKYASIVIGMDRIVRNPGESAATAKVVSLVMLSVAGDIQDNASIENFAASHQSISKDIAFSLLVRNKGNNHIKPHGVIVITNFLGQKVGEMPLDGENVLPGALRKMSTTWKPNRFLFGRYAATIISTYGYKDDLTLTGVSTFWVFPAGLLITLAIIVLILIAVIKYRKLVFGDENQK